MGYERQLKTVQPGTVSKTIQMQTEIIKTNSTKGTLCGAGLPAVKDNKPDQKSAEHQDQVRTVIQSQKVLTIIRPRGKCTIHCMRLLKLWSRALIMSWENLNFIIYNSSGSDDLKVQIESSIALEEFS